MAVSSISSSLTENSSSPFYLSNGDHPGSVLVSQPLTGLNYNTWSRSMIVSLIAKNKMAFIDGSLPQPSPADEATFHAWTRCNNMIIA
jgi:predicted YcjX-like family ATPase